MWRREEREPRDPPNRYVGGRGSVGGRGREWIGVLLLLSRGVVVVCLGEKIQRLLVVVLNVVAGVAGGGRWWIGTTSRQGLLVVGSSGGAQWCGRAGQHGLEFQAVLWGRDCPKREVRFLCCGQKKLCSFLVRSVERGNHRVESVYRVLDCNFTHESICCQHSSCLSVVSIVVVSISIRRIPRPPLLPPPHFFLLPESG